MKNFNERIYNIKELYESYNRKELFLSPKFQRRPVWQPAAKSYLIDTIISERPIPRIFVRESSTPFTSTKREVIDGQQRLKAIFDFINDGFAISKTHNATYGGKVYSLLPEDVRKEFLSYPISTMLVMDLSDEVISDIFARLNTYAVRLNPQELLNSQFFGLFKKQVYQLAAEYRTFWIESKILTENDIARMKDAQLVSELLAVILEGRILSFSFDTYSKIYKKYEENYELSDQITTNFKVVLDLFSRVYGENFEQTEFQKVPLFYSTFLVLYHFMFHIGWDYEIASTDMIDSVNVNVSKIKTALDEINSIAQGEVYSASKAADVEKFIMGLKKNTTTPNVRINRCQFISEIIKRSLEN